MRVYLDSSAIVKLVQIEPESPALRRYLLLHRGDQQATCELARVEVVRAVLRGGPAAVALAHRQLARLYQLPLDRGLLDAAAMLPATPPLRSLDAVHVAAAQLVGAELRALVTYDSRLAEAATMLGMSVEAPG